MDEPETLQIAPSHASDHVSPVLGRYFERSWSHGQGHRLYDTAGKGYLDFANGIAVTSLGHSHPAVSAAIHAQVDRLIGPTGAIGYSEPVARLAGLLAATLPEPIDTVFFLNSGSEAIEAALKLARRVTGRPAIIAFHGAFHGRTLGAASITSSSLNYRAGYEPLLPAVYLTPFPAVYRDFGGDEELATRTCLDALERLTSSVVPADSVAAIVIEPVQGEGGYNPAPLDFLRRLRAFCDEHGILLVADEIQTGYGRTGRMWAFEHAGIVPDAVCIARRSRTGCRCQRSPPGANCRNAGARAPTARRTVATRSPVPPGLRSSRRSSARGWSPTRRRAASSSRRVSRASRPRTPGSATSVAPG